MKPPGPLPPSTHKSIAANGRNPLTGALLYFRPGQTIPPVGSFEQSVTDGNAH